ncbi:MAG TPA: THUMP domain-containing protein, partial [Candidatus Thermoplasmatota archaeon]
MQVLMWLSGEHPTMPRAEAIAAFLAESPTSKVIQERPRLLLVESGASADDTRRIVARLGLVHDASEFLFGTEWEPATLQRAAAASRLPRGIRFAVRADRLGQSGPRRTTVEKDVGGALMLERQVDLKKPDTMVRCFIDGDYVWTGKQIWARDPKESEARHVKHRPIGSPVSLPPKTARALLNLAMVPNRGTVYDPFCGTGGVLLEGASMGFRVIGSDLDRHMVTASKANLAHYRLSATDVFRADVGDAPNELVERGLPKVDAVVTDLPYGRSASSGKEALGKLYDRAFVAIRDCLPSGARAV